MSTVPRFAAAAEARKSNWFSRRHQTSGPHQDARKMRENRKMAQFQATEERIKRQNAEAEKKDAQ